MSVATEETTQPCPQCGAEIRSDRRFTTWCAACDWNVDPARPQEHHGRLERTQRALARRHGEKLLAEVTAGGTLQARRDAPAVLAQAIALAVHGVTLVLAAAGVWFVVRGWGGVRMVPGLFLLLLAWALRPRTNRLPDDAPVLRRAAAPELFALLDEVARVAGTRNVDAIVVGAELNAGVTTYGVRGRRLLTLGLPLWEILTPQQRIALLGHELGHYGNGDTRHGLVVGTAFRSLTTWRYYFAPIADPTLIQMVVNLAYFVPRLLVQSVLLLLDQLTLRATQRAEYLADRVAARAASTEATVGLMDRLLVGDSAATTLRREAAQAGLGGPRRAGRDEDRTDGLWERLAAHMASIPEYEYERQRRAGALRGHSVDATHPPTHLRRACLLTGEAVPAAVVTDGERELRIAAELADVRGRVARQILRDGFDG
ncbi:M48 family metallopeptidase [Streptomyces sp. NPDC059010]|uniref:M48 family metallopeptidase n=1 Tax=Streptomyces sp. NPDC059010 TaxID=3346695 RepID=UPI0036AD8E41